jgi:aryl-alcohol dehydrogenase-like predicted oxidoreductase
MEYATLGNTGLLVSKLCFGTMTFGDGRGFFKARQDVVIATKIYSRVGPGRNDIGASRGGPNQGRADGARPRQRSAWPAQPRHDGRCLKAEGQRRYV